MDRGCGPIRPNKQAFKTMYERGYRTWFILYEIAVADIHSHVPWWELEAAFPSDLVVDAAFSNIAFVKGTSTWRTTNDSCDLPSFEQEFLISVASDARVWFWISQMRSRDGLVGKMIMLLSSYLLGRTFFRHAGQKLCPGHMGLSIPKNEANWDVSKL